MKTIIAACLVALCTIQPTMAIAKTKTVTLRIIETSDVHGSFFPYDFVNRKSKGGSLARVVTYVNKLRSQYGDNVILLENGDILQGQPTCYYSNYIKTDKENIAASIVNYMKYDAQGIGNHDVETGHSVYDKWIKEVTCPVLAANIINTKTETPYVKPYTILVRDGVRIAVIGMLTPAIPNWLNETLWSDLRFEDIEKSARQWVEYVKTKEKADVVIGLFHSGWDGGIVTPDYVEDATAQVAKNVPGFDLILYGHDHRKRCETVQNVNGDNVLCLDPSNNAFFVCDATIEVTKRGKRVVSKSVKGDVVSISNEEIDNDFMTHFATEREEINNFVNRRIGYFDKTISTRDCFFGSSEFTDFIHDIQLKITGADVSFNAPLSFDSKINKGDVFVADLFNLYRFENQICMMRMTGEEIRKHLEMSYDLWCNTMKSADDHIMLLTESTKDDMQRYGFKNFTFNFDSAAGIDYIVDVTKPDGQKVKILRMSNGQPFDETKWYNVALNSYRANGGGELLTRGAGIPREKLKERIVFESEKDQRYYIMQLIEKADTISPKAHGNWRFVPEEWTNKAIERDRALIFK